MKWNKKKFADGIHAFYEGITILATIDKMEWIYIKLKKKSFTGASMARTPLRSSSNVVHVGLCWTTMPSRLFNNSF